MYPAELEIKDTTESTTSASYLDLLLSIGRDGQLHTSIYDKRDDFNFHITNFPFLSSNIPSSPAYGVFISQLIRYSRACSSYECFILRARRLSNKLLKQGYLAERLKIVIQEVLWSIWGSYSAVWSIPLTNVKWHSDPWPTVTSQPIRLSTNFMTLIPSLTFTDYEWFSMEHLQRVWHASRERLPLRDTWFRPPFWGGLHVLWLLRPVSPTLHRLNDLPKLTFTELRGFHGAFATGVACQQGALTLPDTWFRPPFWDLLVLQLLRPNSSNLPCLYSTFHIEYPLVLSRFCLI